jgi:hypothetical protein
MFSERSTIGIGWAGILDMKADVPHLRLIFVVFEFRQEEPRSIWAGSWIGYEFPILCICFFVVELGGILTSVSYYPDH